MKPLTLALWLALIGAGASASGGYSAHATGDLCVGSRPGCFATIQAAVDAAHDGDAIAVAPGTYAGGVTIDVSVDLIGAGFDKTIISGGGPVLTIGQQNGPRRTVSIRGVTISGGVNNSAPDTVVSLGGGVSIPWSTGFTTGATVTIADSVIIGNTVTPQATASFCGAPVCAFAFGGGIDNAGTLNVTNTRVTDNQSGGDGSVTLGADFATSFRSPDAVAIAGIDDLLDRLERGEFDLVAVGRALIANPEWAAKIKTGALDELRTFDRSLLTSLL